MKKSNKEWETDFPLIPTSQITDEAREIAVRWGDEYFPGFAMQEKQKLASDIMNYARRERTDLECKYALEKGALHGVIQSLLKDLPKDKRAAHVEWIEKLHGQGIISGFDWAGFEL